MSTSYTISYPQELPVARERKAILEAMEQSQVVVVVGDTGSGKTTQLPKMALEYAKRAGIERGRVGCTQPRRIAAASVAKRVVEEMQCQLGQAVGYQVRFEEKVSKETALKFMTDGILLAETQGDPRLKAYHTIIIDEAHERSLNIDFLLGYLKRLLEKRKDLRVLISSATLDAGGFAKFFGGCPVVEVEGRTFPVEVEYLPPEHREDMASHVTRAVEAINRYDDKGDILVFLPGEREIRDCTDKLEGQKWARTEICPLFARLGLGDQQKIFNPKPGQRRIVLATNVAETSLTIPGMIYVIDSGVARMSRWNPGRQVQRLQIEEISQASARQRKGRCGRVCEGICVRLYDEEDFLGRPEFTDPEIRRSSLAGVILRMKSLGLPEIADFPFIDPPKSGNIVEGYKTLREIGALDSAKELTPVGRQLARLPVEPRLGRMLLAAADTGCLGEVLIIVSGLTIMDPRERPSDKQEAADKAHAQWADEDSDFLGYLHLWDDLMEFYQGRGKWQRNQLRRYCRENFLNFRRIMEWDNLRYELGQLGSQQLKWCWDDFDGHGIETAEYQKIHEALLTGIPRQFGGLDTRSGDYQSAAGGKFAIFPGSGLFGKKKPDWVVAFEMVDTTRLWARRVAKIDPQWMEHVAPHLCRSRYHSAYWNKKQGAVYAKEVVVCGGLNIVEDRRVHYGRVEPQMAREVFLRDGLLGDGLVKKPAFLQRIAELQEEVESIEQKTRRRGGLWHDDIIYDFLAERIPADMSTAKAFHKWMRNADNAASLMPELHDLVDIDEGELGLADYPDRLEKAGETYPLHYRDAPGEPDDGVTIEIALSQLHAFPDWLPSWGVPGDLEARVLGLIRSLPKAMRVACQPVAETASAFLAAWDGWEPELSIEVAMGEFLSERTGQEICAGDFDHSKLPGSFITKLWVYSDETGEEVGMGTDVAALKSQLKHDVEQQFDVSFGTEWDSTGQTTWPIGDFVDVVEAGSRQAWPALVDEGESIGSKLFLHQGQAELSHQLGCGRLFLLDQPRLRTYLEKDLPMSLETRMMMPLLGQGGIGKGEFCLLAAAGAMGPTYPRSAADYATASEHARGIYHDQAVQLGKWIDQLVASYSPISAFIEANRDSEHLGESVEDIESQIAWLLRERFLPRAGWARLKDLPRYFRGIEERIQRLESQPIARDLEKLDRIIPFVDDWLDLCEEQPTHVTDEIGFAIEELRLSLFAPNVPTGMKVSEKRLSKMFEEIHRVMG